MKFLIIADPVESLTAETDSGLSMLREALRRGHDVSWATPKDLRLYQDDLHVRAARVGACDDEARPTLEKTDEGIRVETFDGVWIRKDPPFDLNYLSMCWLLALVEPTVPMINSPELLLRYHEKLLPHEATRAGLIKKDELVPTFMVTGEGHHIPRDFPAGEIVSKPWFGYGGSEVEKWGSIQEALDAAYGPEEALTLFQPFLSQVIDSGDRRVIFINGEYAGDVVRIPQPGSIRANLVQGAKAERREMTAQEKDLTTRVGQFLKSIGIQLAGADYISGRLTEINITAPTGFEAIADLEQPNPSVKYLDLAESLANRKNK